MSSTQQQQLTLLDLPGLVQTHDIHDSASLKTDIEHLVGTYLTNPRCILLAVLSSNVDYHNSLVLELAKRVGPHRTLGILTKPDLMDAGAEAPIIELLQNRRVPLMLGYHMVKLRGQAALDEGMTIEQGRQEEERYFATVEPWKSVIEEEEEEKEDVSLFGIENLRRKLGKLQCRMMKQVLPDILQQVRKKGEETFEALVGMGNLQQNASSTKHP